MDAYYEAIESVLAKEGGRLIIALIGVSGSGKTTLAQRLKHRYTAECTILSLDTIREELNNGVYPEKQDYQRIHKAALPIFHDKLESCDDRIIIIDNTNLRFNPDIQTILKAANKKHSYFLTMSPHWSEYGLTIWRPDNAHNVTHETFLNMICRWPRKTFDEFIYKLVAPQDTLLLGSHIKDINVPRHIYVKQWGRGCLYILGQYIGYMDADIARGVMKSGTIMSSVGADDLFLNKTPPVHMTIYFRNDRSIKLNNIIEKLVAAAPEPPAVEFSGLHHSNAQQAEAENDIWFMTVTDACQDKWCELFADAGLTFEQNLHVTVGYTNTDQHDINKRVVPTYSFDGANENVDFVSPYRGKYEPTISFTANVSMKELDHLQCHHSLPEQNAYLTNLRWLNGHRHTALRWRKSGDVALCMIKVKSGVDDEAYKSDPRLLTLLPRGLCYVFHKDELLGLVYPTNKFFGDEDNDDDVDVMDERTLAHDTAAMCQSMIVTEKANGEMFTVTCFKLQQPSDDDTYLFVLGSKNNKFPVKCDLAKIEHMEDVYTTIEYFLTPKERQFFQAYRKDELPHSRKWFTDRMWIEMTLYFFKQLAGLDLMNRRSWCQRMSDGALTACGEFETANHPHLIQFPPGHEDICFFALTTHNENGEPVKKSCDLSLVMMDEHGFHTVKRYAKTIHNVEEMLAFRQQIWRREDSEGVVLHFMTESGALERMVKLKTMWYVGYRGIRERLRRFQGRWHLDENEDKMKSQVCDVALSKLRFFKFANDSDLNATRELWKKRASTVVERLIAIARRDVADAALTFQYNYPSLLLAQQ